MGGHKHLHELLKEDQEPFHLKNFIADRCTTIVTGAGKPSLHLQKQKPPKHFYIKNLCLLNFQDSPDFNKKSPFPDFQAKSPSNNAGVFLHIPAKTAAMLLDAATRVQKPKPGSKQTGFGSFGSFGLFGSFLRRLKDRSIRTKRCELEPGNIIPTSSPARRSRKKSGAGSTVSSGVWSEKSSEMETSCSSRSIHEFEEIDECFCSNPSSPFRFSLQRNPANTCRKVGSSSPVVSPSRHLQQVKESYEGELTQEIHRQEGEEKEQCSPVSVLDPLFNDDEEERDGGPTEEDCYDIECSYASVQRAKHQLLLKLQRFERLAGLDPVNLEKHMLEQLYNEDEEDEEDGEDKEAKEDDVLGNGLVVTNEEFVREIMNYLGVGKIPWYMKKLVFDLIEEENKNEEHQVVVQKVCKRLHSWKVVELNTIDMMVETDFKSEGWKKCDHEEKIRETGRDIEAAVFAFLVEELAQELIRDVIFRK